ncbi:class A beta-lactamase-related serine hydrolase [Pseudolysobacter antarcticus]|uniref:Class A beta-lactamase-related serine hydrolase n=1 Tax=Pseudolysobacter antarcticus TaxID=2511995 RepID=A0A411HKK7_9GAMM|nr:serine hydrolase domain-containing protein [Pseudolysobacter antarcticus]QBB71066.1 class A beta-lactamase-related serine hydrolase [Pseudolysobacter antarcticus]
MILRRSVFASLLVLLVCSDIALARAPTIGGLSRDRAIAVDAAVEAEMKNQHVVGVAVGIVENGKVVYSKGYGLADREKNIPVTTDTMFRWASCSKMLTAIATMQLVQKNALNIDADVRKLVPEFPDKGVTITTRELLDHQSGIVHYDNGKVIRTQRSYAMPHPFADVILALDTFKESPLVNPPGEKYSYSTHGFILLSAVVQRAGKQAFATQVSESIGQPLGLVTLRPDYQWLNIPNRAVGYRKHDEKIERSSDTDVSWKLGGGGFISNIDDFANFAAGLINHRLVSSKIETEMWTPQTLKNGELTERGLGFVVQIDKSGKLKISHDGEQEKTRTRLVIYPHEKRGVVVMTNSEWVDPGKFSTTVYAALDTH